MSTCRYVTCMYRRRVPKKGKTSAHAWAEGRAAREAQARTELRMGSCPGTDQQYGTASRPRCAALTSAGTCAHWLRQGGGRGGELKSGLHPPSFCAALQHHKALYLPKPLLTEEGLGLRSPERRCHVCLLLTSQPGPSAASLFCAGAPNGRAQLVNQRAGKPGKPLARDSRRLRCLWFLQAAVQVS